MFSRKHQTLLRLSPVSSSWPVQFPLTFPSRSVSMAEGPRVHRHVLSYRRTASRECWHTGAGNRLAVGGSEGRDQYDWR